MTRLKNKGLTRIFGMEEKEFQNKLNKKDEILYLQYFLPLRV